jgi:hypothetical protein
MIAFNPSGDAHNFQEQEAIKSMRQCCGFRFAHGWEQAVIDEHAADFHAVEFRDAGIIKLDPGVLEPDDLDDRAQAAVFENPSE